MICWQQSLIVIAGMKEIEKLQCRVGLTWDPVRLDAVPRNCTRRRRGCSVVARVCRVDSDDSDYWCAAMGMETCLLTSTISRSHPADPYSTSWWRFSRACACRDSDPGCKVLQNDIPCESAARKNMILEAIIGCYMRNGRSVSIVD